MKLSETMLRGQETILATLKLGLFITLVFYWLSSISWWCTEVFDNNCDCKCSINTGTSCLDKRLYSVKVFVTVFLIITHLRVTVFNLFKDLSQVFKSWHFWLGCYTTRSKKSKGPLTHEEVVEERATHMRSATIEEVVEKMVETLRDKKIKKIRSISLNLLSSVGRYSLTSRFQKWFIIWCRFVHVLKLAANGPSKFPVDRELNERMTRRLIGVRGISLSERSATFVRGRQLNMASLSTSFVWNSSIESLFEPIKISSVLFAFRIQRSQTPPKWGP